MSKMTPQEMAQKIGSGLLSFPVTPFKADYSFDEATYRANMDWLCGYDVAGLFAAGGTGEFFSLTPTEVPQVVKVAVEETKGRVPVLAGTGYGTAIAARLARRVVGVECDARLAGSAVARLAELGLGNAEMVEGALAQGYPGRAPYQVVLFEGRVGHIPDAIAAQVAEDGRIVAVLGDEGGMGRAVLMTRSNGVLSRRPVFDAAVPALPGLERAPSFVF